MPSPSPLPLQPVVIATLFSGHLRSMRLFQPLGVRDEKRGALSHIGKDGGGGGGDVLVLALALALALTLVLKQ